MSIKFVISFEVANFDDFKTGFEQGRPFREEAGISESEAYRNLDSSNNVWVLGTVTYKEAFLEFFGTDAQKERMKNAGIISPPTITFLES
jgi:hypothetical protein